MADVIKNVKVRFTADDSDLENVAKSWGKVTAAEKAATGQLDKFDQEAKQAHKDAQTGATKTAAAQSKVTSAVGDTGKSFTGLKGAVSGVTTEIKSAASNINIFGVNAGTATNILSSGLKSSVGGFNLLKIAIAGTGIGLLLVAFGSLLAYFKSTELGSEKLERALSGFGAAVAAIVGNLAQFGKILVDAFQSPGVALQKFGSLLKEFVVDKIQQLIGGIKGIGTAFIQLFSGDFKAAAATAGQAIIDINRAVNPLVITYELQLAAIKKLTGGAKEAAMAAIEITRALQDVEDDERNLSVAIAKQRNEIQLLIIQSKNRSLTDKQRTDALLKANQLEVDIVNQQIVLQKKKVAALQQETDLKLKNKQLDVGNKTQDLIDAEIELENLRGNSIELQEKNQNRIDNLAIASAKKKISITKDADKAAIDQLNKNIANEVNIVDEGNKEILDSIEKRNELAAQSNIDLADNVTEAQAKSLNDQLRDYDDFVAKQKQAAQDAADKLIEQQKRVQEVAQLTTAIGNAFFDIQSNNRDADLAKLQTNYDKQIAAAGDNKVRQAAIEAKYAKDQAKIKRAQTQADKQQALFNIAINTAVAVSKVITQPYLIALAIAVGAAQAAVVASKPLPQFAKGTKSVPGVNRGYDSVLAMLQPEEAVIPVDKNKKYKPIINGIIDGTLDPRMGRLIMGGSIMVAAQDNKELISEVKALRRDMKSHKQVDITLDEKGFTKSIHQGNAKTEIKNNYFNG